MSWVLRGKTAVTGLGWTEYSKNSGRSVLSLAVEACEKAINDSGIDMSRVDGILCYGLNDSVQPQAVTTALGLPRLSYYANYFGGGNVCAASVGTAAMVVGTGMADNVLVFRALNGRSQHRLGGTGMEERFAHATHESQFTFPFGWLSYPQYIAMCARRHMLKYGTTSEDFGHVAVTCRSHAVLNERAMMRKPITLEDHQNSRMIADPLRLLDICLETDGACAMLVSSADEARTLKQRPVYILGFNQGGGPRPGYAFDGFYSFEELADLYAQYIAPKMWSLAGVGPKDMDLACIYDCFTFSVISQLEGFGFCKAGEGGQFVRDGRIGLEGELPLNPNGGMLSEGYIHGLNGVVELASQLRGQSGVRQVKGAEVGLATGFGVTTGCGIVMSNAN
jgi:acetyl-CoA acetyltransferase